LDSNGFLRRIDPNTAATTLIGNTGSDFWLDMTIPVPEPAAATLLALGLLVPFGYARLRRARK
jgi:hypothetical protein